MIPTTQPQIPKQLIQILAIAIFLLNATLLKAQFNSKKYDKQSFLIGMLNEYMGYQRTFTNRDDFYFQRINIMSRNDLKKALFIDSLFSMEYPDLSIEQNSAPMGIKIYSPVLSKEIDAYYHYEGGSLRTFHGDTIFFGKPKKEMFISKQQKQSFLLGAYLSFGKDQTAMNSIIRLLKNEHLLDEHKAYENVSYGFSMPNAPSKAKLCAQLLNDVGCKEVIYVYRKTIPTGNFVIFTPSRKMLQLINESKRLETFISAINSDDVEFTTDGDKYIWKTIEQVTPPKQKFDFKEFEGIKVKAISNM